MIDNGRWSWIWQQTVVVNRILPVKKEEIVQGEACFSTQNIVPIIANNTEHITIVEVHYFCKPRFAVEFISTPSPNSKTP